VTEINGPALAAGVLRVFEPRAKAKGLALRLDAAAGLPALRGDADQIERLLFNLVDNAVKYTDKGSVTLALKIEGTDYILEVSDTGPGIPPNTAPGSSNDSMSWINPAPASWVERGWDCPSSNTSSSSTAEPSSSTGMKAAARSSRCGCRSVRNPISPE